MKHYFITKTINNFPRISLPFQSKNVGNYNLISFFLFPCSLPQKIDRPLCASGSSSNEQYQFDQSYNSNSQHHHDNLDSYDLEDDILCDNMDDNNMDDNSHHSYVFLQQQQHYTPPPLPPPIEFQEGSQQSMTQQPQQQQQHQTLIKKGSIMRNNPELMKRNRQNNS